MKISKKIKQNLKFTNKIHYRLSLLVIDIVLKEDIIPIDLVLTELCLKNSV